MAPQPICHDEPHCHTSHRAPIQAMRRYATTGASGSLLQFPNTTPRHASSSPAAAQPRQTPEKHPLACCELSSASRVCVARSERVSGRKHISISEVTHDLLCLPRRHRCYSGRWCSTHRHHPQHPYLWDICNVSSRETPVLKHKQGTFLSNR